MNPGASVGRIDHRGEHGAEERMQGPIKAVLRTSWGSQSWVSLRDGLQEVTPEMSLGTASRRVKNCTHKCNGSPNL